MLAAKSVAAKISDLFAKLTSVIAGRAGRAAVEAAKAAQGTKQYPGVDDWRSTTLKAGDIVAGLTPGQSAF